MLLQKIKKKKARIAIIGLGYVGLPLALEFAKLKLKYPILGIDIDPVRVRSVNAGRSYVTDIQNSHLKKFIETKRIVATTDNSLLAKADCIIICVPTPLRKTGTPDVSYILSAVSQIKKNLRKGHLIILESTTYPGTTAEVVKPLLERTGLKAGRDFYLAFSPERVDPGNNLYQIHNTPKVLGGITPACLERALALYNQIIEQVVPVSSATTAEMVKLLENSFRMINIAFVNEMAKACERLNLNIWEIVEAAKTKPFGFMTFYPGPGIGGHCLPTDPVYLTWKLKKLKSGATEIIDLAARINLEMPLYIIKRLTDLLRRRGKLVKNAKILILGITYKPDINDPRESPGIDLLTLLKRRKVQVYYHDPYIREVEIDHHRVKRSDLSPILLKKADCTVIITPHSSYRWQWIADHARLIFDTRDALGALSPNPKVVKL